MNAPMMRARLNGRPCQVEGHGSRCERVDDRDPITRAQENQRWRNEVAQVLADIPRQEVSS